MILSRRTMKNQNFQVSHTDLSTTVTEFCLRKKYQVKRKKIGFFFHLSPRVKLFLIVSESIILNNMVFFSRYFKLFGLNG